MKMTSGKKTAIALAVAHLALYGLLNSPALAQQTIAGATPAVDIETLLKPFSQVTPGCAVGVEHGRDPIIFRAAGSATLEQDIPINANTVFEAGSVSKQFTAAAMLLLAREGAISLDDDVRRYVPELPDYGSPIRIRHLLNHTSGLRDWGSVQDIAGWPRGDKVYGMREALRIMARQKSLNYEPGTAYSYTNSGYNLLAVVVERVSGKTLQAFSKERLFDPLHLTHTRWRDDFRAIVPRRATAYADTATGYSQRMPFENVVGNGGLLTTVGDLLLWNRALSEGKIGSGITQQMEEPGKLKDGRQIKYGIGLFVDRYRGFAEAYHEGQTAGYHTWLSRFPDQALSIAILCNSQNIDTFAMGHRIADLFLPANSVPVSVDLTGEEITALEGLYVNQRSGLPFRLIRRDNALYVSANGAAVPLSSATPVKKDANGSLISGRVGLQVLGGNKLRQALVGDGFILERAAVFPAWEKQPKGIAGRYRGTEIDAIFSISQTPKCLSMTVEDRPTKEECLQPIYEDAFLFGNTLVRLVRSSRGVVTGLRLSNDRVWDLRVDRIL